MDGDNEDRSSSPIEAEAETEASSDPAAVDAFIARWEGADGTERANYQIFLTERTWACCPPPPSPTCSPPCATTPLSSCR